MINTLLNLKNLVTEFHTDSKVVTAVNNVFTLNKVRQLVLLVSQVLESP